MMPWGGSVEYSQSCGAPSGLNLFSSSVSANTASQGTWGKHCRCRPCSECLQRNWSLLTCFSDLNLGQAIVACGPVRSSLTNPMAWASGSSRTSVVESGLPSTTRSHFQRPSPSRITSEVHLLSAIPLGSHHPNSCQECSSYAILACQQWFWFSFLEALSALASPSLSPLIVQSLNRVPCSASPRIRFATVLVR